MNVLLCNGKGGTGKTTLAVLLAHALAESGKAVAVHDRDPQGTATKWLRENDGGKVQAYNPAATYDAVFVDTPPRLDTLAAALSSCSVAVIVCSPSPADLWATRDTAEAIRPHLPAKTRLRLLFNGVMSNTILARELPDLAKRVGVKALASSISRRQCYQHAALLGWQALDASAREEIFKAAIELLTE
jgi:chromosome partitioning protein